MVNFKNIPQRLVRKAFRQAGLEIRRFQVETPTVARSSFQGSLHQAIQNGLAPKTVIDVGVATGTPELYKAFPKAHHFLIEPLEENIPYLKEWVK